MIHDGGDAGRVPRRAKDRLLLQPGPNPAGQRHGAVRDLDLNAPRLSLRSTLEGILDRESNVACLDVGRADGDLVNHAAHAGQKAHGALRVKPLLPGDDVPFESDPAIRHGRANEVSWQDDIPVQRVRCEASRTY